MAIKPINVTQLNRYIGRVMQTDPILGNVSVIGEISNLKYHSSGHIYFTLKDAGSRINCFLSAKNAAGLRYELTDGMEIVVNGFISVFEKGGYYSLNIRTVDVSGAGSLAAAYKALFDRLQKEGLFEEAHKKELPAFPKKICVITSPTGAALRDILKIIRSRNFLVDVLIYPCLVQGDAAAGQIAAAIQDVNRRFPEMDVIITGRGGGSREELWAFNEEIVARSIFESQIPVISAVGHETDFSISDYAADRRAETPTAAAVMAVPDLFRIKEEMEEHLKSSRSRLQRVLSLKNEAMKRYSGEMLDRFFGYRVEKCLHSAAQQKELLELHMQKRLEAAEAGMEKCRIMLEAGNPAHMLKKGYAIVQETDTGRILTRAQQLKAQGAVTVKMQGGSFLADIREIQETE